MPACVAPFCRSRAHSAHSVKSSISFFRFPLTDQARLRAWLVNLRRTEWKPTAHSRLCAAHFEHQCLTRDSRGNVRLLRTAVPTIFPGWNRGKPEPSAADPSAPSLDHTYCLPDEAGVPGPAGENAGAIEDIIQVTVKSPPPSDTEQEERPAPRVSASCGSVGTVNPEPAPVSPEPAVHPAFPTAFHSYVLPDSQNLKGTLNTLRDKLHRSRRRGRSLLQTIRRLRKKVASLEVLVKELQGRDKIASEYAKLAQGSLSGVAMTILQRIQEKKKTTSKSSRVSKELKSFALALHLHSPEAYDYVRESFDQVLPHPETVRVWRNRNHRKLKTPAHTAAAVTVENGAPERMEESSPHPAEGTEREDKYV